MSANPFLSSASGSPFNFKLDGGAKQVDVEELFQSTKPKKHE